MKKISSNLHRAETRVATESVLGMNCPAPNTITIETATEHPPYCGAFLYFRDGKIYSHILKNLGIEFWEIFHPMNLKSMGTVPIFIRDYYIRNPHIISSRISRINRDCPRFLIPVFCFRRFDLKNNPPKILHLHQKDERGISMFHQGACPPHEDIANHHQEVMGLYIE